MNNNSTLQQDDFEALLCWLSANRDEAGEKYEQVREGLIRFFHYKGCQDSQGLADETINRVAARISTLDTTKNYKTITYFYGFAANILLEYNRKMRKENISLESVEDFQYSTARLTEDSNDDRFKCLEKCLKKLSAEDRELIIVYYSKEKLEKIQIRKQLAERFHCEMNALQVRVFRLRNLLRKCVQNCVKESL